MLTIIPVRLFFMRANTLFGLLTISFLAPSIKPGQNMFSNHICLMTEYIQTYPHNSLDSFSHLDHACAVPHWKGYCKKRGFPESVGHIDYCS